MSLPHFGSCLQVEKLLAASREETKSLRSFERLVEQEGRHLEEEKQRLR